MASGASGDNGFAATVARASYLGTAVDYQVAVEGTDVTLRVTAPVSPRFAPGDRVALSVEPTACVPLRR